MLTTAHVTNWATLCHVATNRGVVTWPYTHAGVARRMALPAAALQDPGPRARPLGLAGGGERGRWVVGEVALCLYNYLTSILDS